ncbi:MurR/RpiR family transcriptional regulator [Paenactinomyces guangxiensis]|uniref:MurR/RpiR family transcriptional regulator n=1 Tax=Paenactinomyces guangxiensis TaxID=1490290 RepID=A0A7W1WN23_9BACL|nr:MurR/RpiR family transcriptional regulator [Paenactinomyces guangxiensis]MBA4492855.1 MurR/RpiR family transcriptional regulator [Paenactinomyces guangxiensis]MBH8590296.1 MurR/RpiR family transcriptional regulator [Paenactinomyces guangxiensis]
MHSQSVLERIQTDYHLFSAKERQLADYIVKHKETIANINIGELADKTNTSPSTITRFCKKLGCQNFVEFKVLLNRSTFKKLPDEDYLNQVKHNYLESIQSTAAMLNMEQVNQVIQWIKEAGKIGIYGVGSSGLSALELKYRLMRMGFLVDALIDSHLMLMNATLVRRQDLIIAISNSGTTKEVIEAVREAKRQGAKVVSITNHDYTPLTNASDLVLLTSSTSRLNDPKFINNQLTILYVLDVISMRLLEEEGPVHNRDLTLQVLMKHKKI